MYAAWICDDERAEAAGKRCRERAADLFGRARGNREAFADDAGSEDLVLVDVLRRLERFADADACRRAALERCWGTVSGKILEFQGKLIATRDSAVHLFEEVRIPTFDLRPPQITDAFLAERVRAVPRLESLYLFDAPITDAGLEALQGMTNLSDLNIGGIAIGDVGLAHLAGLTRLRKLTLSKTAITDAGLMHLKGLTSLEVLFLTGTQITDRGLKHLEHVRQLRELWLYNTPITNKGVQRLCKQLLRLKVLR